MFYNNGSVLVGKFVDGVPSGPVHYVWADGSFYKGNVEKNTANDTVGLFECDQYTYRGAIKNNNFDGEGTLESRDSSYKFSGIF